MQPACRQAGTYDIIPANRLALIYFKHYEKKRINIIFGGHDFPARSVNSDIFKSLIDKKVYF